MDNKNMLNIFVGLAIVVVLAMGLQTVKISTSGITGAQVAPPAPPAPSIYPLAVPAGGDLAITWGALTFTSLNSPILSGTSRTSGTQLCVHINTGQSRSPTGAIDIMRLTSPSGFVDTGTPTVQGDVVLCAPNENGGYRLEADAGLATPTPTHVDVNWQNNVANLLEFDIDIDIDDFGGFEEIEYEFDVEIPNWDPFAPVITPPIVGGGGLLVYPAPTTGLIDPVTGLPITGPTETTGPVVVGYTVATAKIEVKKKEKKEKVEVKVEWEDIIDIELEDPLNPITYDGEFKFKLKKGDLKISGEYGASGGSNGIGSVGDLVNVFLTATPIVVPGETIEVGSEEPWDVLEVKVEPTIEDH